MTARRRPRPVVSQRRPALPPHRHDPEDGEPTTWDGRQVCRTCHKPGRPGDAQHPTDLPDPADTYRPATLPDVSDEVREFEARRLGEAGAS